MSTRKKTSSRRPGNPAGARPGALIGDPFAAQIALVRGAVELTKAEVSKRSLPGAEAGVLFDAAVLAQAAEALDATTLLVEHAHWRAAAGTVRQLFELLLNMEHLSTYEDRKEGVTRYWNFGLLQRSLFRVESYKYLRDTGRPVDEAKAAAWLALMSFDDFAVFRGKVTKEGEQLWAKSWSGLSTWQLCKESVYSRRKLEYNTLFASWSELVHAAPSSTTAFHSPEDWSGQTHTQEAMKGLELLSLGLAFLVGIWTVLPDVRSLEDGLVSVLWMSNNADLVNQILSTQGPRLDI